MQATRAFVCLRLWITWTKNAKLRYWSSPLSPPAYNNIVCLTMNSFWRSCLTHFEQQLPPQQFKTWIKPLKFQAAENELTLTAPNRFVLQWIRDRFLAEIERLAGENLGCRALKPGPL